MGRREEPKLDELQRLLRRLEYMEVDKGGEPAPRAAGGGSKGQAGKGSGYVGALRGAPTVASGETGDLIGSALEPDFSSGAGGDRRSSGTSTASIVIGATTAAVVSSLVVVGLLLYTQGKNSGATADGQRLNFVAPAQNGGSAYRPAAQPADAATPFRQPNANPQPPVDAQTLLQRADVEIRDGRLAEARELLEQAAKLGSGVAALTLGAMYDPNRVAEFGNLGVQADPTLARAWYERAQALGVVEAGNRLSELIR